MAYDVECSATPQGEPCAICDPEERTMPTITMQPEPDVWNREEAITALKNGHAMFTIDGPLVVEGAYPSMVQPELQVVILQPESHQDELRVAFPQSLRDRHFPDGARWRMILIAEECDGG